MPATCQAPPGVAALLHPDPRYRSGALASLSKIGPKSVQNRSIFGNVDSLIAMHQTTYNFNALKWTDFQGLLCIASISGQNLGAESHGSRLGRTVDRRPFFLGEKVRMRDRPVLLSGSPLSATNLSQLYTTRQNGTFSDSQKNQQRCTNDLRKRFPRSSHFRERPKVGRAVPARRKRFVSIGVRSWLGPKPNKTE
jgi:hypothetical protein